MDLIRLFFALDVDPGLLLYGTYDPWLVALSIAIAVFSSGMAMHATVQAREVPGGQFRRLILLAGSVSLGCGIWAMHFIGMLSLNLCTDVQYDEGITVLSLLPGIGASWVALRLLSQEEVTWRQLLISGVLMGAGIGTMHYAGMAAMDMAPHLRYDPWMFALSIAVAVVLAVLALALRFGMRSRMRHQSNLRINLFAGAVMGCAISGMHYTGMAAARFIGQAEAMGSMEAVPLALSIALVTVIATALVAAAGGLVQYRHLIARLRSNENKLQTILDTALDGLLVFDHQGRITEVNPGAETIYGWRQAELIGQPITRLIGGVPEGFDLKDMPAFLSGLEQVAGNEFMAEGRRKDGRALPVRVVLSKIEVERQILFVAYVTDFSERVTMVSELRASEAQFRTLIGNIPGISYRCRPEPGWPMTFISDAVERITGFAASDFMGLNPLVRFASLVPESDMGRMLGQIKSAVNAGEQFVLEFRLRHADGGWRWMWGNGSLVKDDKGVVQFIDGVLLGITERREMEEDLRQAKDVAEAAATARSNFLANMSHEIRTPMNAIIGFTEVVLGSTDLPEEHHKHLETVHRSARSLLRLLNDILDSAKLERGVLELEHIDFNLRELLA